MQIILISYEWMSIRPRFEHEAKGNSELASFSPCFPRFVLYLANASQTRVVKNMRLGELNNSFP